MRERRVKNLTPATRRYRRRVLAMLEARYDAIYQLNTATDETVVVLRTTRRLLDIIRDMR